MKYINTAAERMLAKKYFEEHYLPSNWQSPTTGFSAYFDKYGFKVSNDYAEFYAAMNGNRSDRYLPVDLYYSYISPCLNNLAYRDVYADKNNFAKFLPEVNWPLTVIMNQNGLFYSPEGVLISDAEAANRCAEVDRVIIKPSIESACGRNVALIDSATCVGYQEIFQKYKKNFIVQRILCQSPEMSRLNATSVNTVRIFTYRDSARKIHFLDNASIVRIGAPGSYADNASIAGNIFCSIHPDGVVDDVFYQYGRMEKGSLKDRIGFTTFKIPRFDDAARWVVKLHERLAFFDFIGWDIVVDDSNELRLIEYNVNQPGIELTQIAHGPAFNEDILDDLMSRLNGLEKTKRQYVEHRFGNGNIFRIDI